MAKYLSGNKKFEKVTETDANYIDLTAGFSEITADTGKAGCMSVICTNGSKRLKLNHDLYNALEMPHAVKIQLGKERLAIIAVPEDTVSAFTVGKGGVIYATSLVDKIAEAMPDMEWKENASTRCGRIEQLQEDKNGNTVAIVSLA
ncbi:hypothetical protein [Ruminococcus sp.]|uniref:hypothetical protein n=1 Tax=Ruminococcus sp. TaxID=41978 RepID=UPI0025EFE6D2|nr:hypothetical protein [Ruminococcus sp.]